MDAGPTIDYAYILGASHSGSTLLALLLNAHPDVATIGETSPGKMGDVRTYRCSCGQVIQDCPFWARVTRRMREKHPDFRLDDFGTEFEYPANRLVNHILRCEHRGVAWEWIRDTALHLFPRWSQSQRHIRARCYDLAAMVLAESGKRILVDSSKIAHRLKFLLRIPELDIKVIHLVRDGRAVALTYMRQDEFADSKEPARRRGGRGMGGEATASSLPMRTAAEEWRRCLRSEEYVLAGLARSRWIEVRYEELCRDPQGTLARVHDFLGTRSGRASRDFRAVENHVIGNGMRLDSTTEISLDERWRSVLTEEDLRAFDDVAGEVNRRYGYK
jgi:hypothetical protein